MVNVLVPVEVTDAILLASNVVEGDGPEWSAGVTYSEQDRVILSAAHKVYEAARDLPAGIDPNGAAITDWIEVGATNGYRSFDRRLSAPTVQSGDIVYTIEPETLVRAVGLVGVSAASATVKVKTPGGVTLVERTKILADYSEMVDALTMALIEPLQTDVAVFDDIICQPGNRIEITIGDGSGGDVQISEVVIGDVIVVGEALLGAEVGVEDFSRFETDQFGNVDITERGYRYYTDFPVVVRTADVKRLRRNLAAQRAKFALFYFTSESNDLGTTVYGRFESMSTILSGPVYSDMNLKILGAVHGT